MGKSTATKLATIAWTIGALGALAACSSKDERQSPPMLEDCVDSNCKPAGGSGSGSNPGEGGGAGDGNLPEPPEEEGEAVTMTGTVVSTLDTGFLTAAPFMAGAVVRAKGADGAQIISDAAAGQFTIDDVAAGLSWFALEDPNVMPALLPTLQPVMVDASDPTARLVGVDEQSFDNVLYALQPTKVRVSSSGQAILFFVHANDSLATGASVVEAAFAELVAYDVAGGYEAFETPSEGATGPQGTAILVNVPAVAYPGSLVQVRFEIDGKTQEVPIQIASGYVTRAAVAID